MAASSTSRSSRSNERKVSAAEIINRLRPKLNRLPVASAFLQAAQDLRIGGRGSNALYQYTLQADNVRDLAHWGPHAAGADEAAARLSGRELRPAERRPGRVADLRPGHRGAAWAHSQSLDSALYNAFGQSEVSIIYTQLNQYYVVLEVAPQYWQIPEGLKRSSILRPTSDQRRTLRC